MKKMYLIIVMLLSGNFAFSQYAGQAATNMSAGGQTSNAAAAAAIGQYLGPISEAYQKRTKIDLNEFQGSPYTSNDFAPTILYYKDENLGKIYYRYNALNGEIEIKKTNLEEEGYQALARDKDLSIIVDDNPLSFKTFVTSKNNTENGYLSIIKDGEKYDLFKRTHVKYTEGQPAQNSFVAAVPSRFSHFTEYYIQKKGVNRIDEIPLKNRKLIKLLDDSEKARTKTFLKKNDLNIKNEADLIEVIDYLNQ